MHKRIRELVEALTDGFSAHPAFLCRKHLQRMDEVSAAIEDLSSRIATESEPFRHPRTLLRTIPGVGPTAAEVIIAETGGDMTRFPTAGHLASWAGLCPGQHESAGRQPRPRRRRLHPHRFTSRDPTHPAASPDKPTPSASPSASTPCRSHNHRNNHQTRSLVLKIKTDICLLVRRAGP
jgi:hypothetical protein